MRGLAQRIIGEAVHRLVSGLGGNHHRPGTVNVATGHDCFKAHAGVFIVYAMVEQLERCLQAIAPSPDDARRVGTRTVILRCQKRFEQRAVDDLMRFKHAQGFE